MTGLGLVEVEEWLDAHPEAAKEYFQKRAEVPWVNTWLASRGYPLLEEGSPTAELLPCLPQTRRNSSKKCLRHDFARSKSRSLYKTQEISNFVIQPRNSIRRSSLKDLRKYTSLPPNSVSLLSLLIESKVRLPESAPTQGRAAKRAFLRAQGERAFFLSCVRDIATDLDISSISHKIVDNLAVLLEADGASLFLVEKGPKKSLVSKVFDVHSGAGKFLLPAGCGDNQVQVPWGVGVIGHVAETGKTVNLQIACEDPRFDDEVDRIMGYHTESLLCMPVKNVNDEIIAVAQVINKTTHIEQTHFSQNDEKLFETYLQFVGIALTNAQLMSASRKEYDRNRTLLEVVHDLFEEQTCLEKVILKVMERAQKLLKCERAAVLLVDDHQPKGALKFTKLFELTPRTSQAAQNGDVQGEQGISQYLLELAERVVKAGKVVNISEEHLLNGNASAFLAMPIRNSTYQIIGIATIINKHTGLPFDDGDEQLFEAFSIFCGLVIHNSMMFTEIEKAMARQKVTFEVLSYHAIAAPKEVETLVELGVPQGDEMNLYSLSFDDFSLGGSEMILGAVTMFVELGLVTKFNIDTHTLYRFLLTVKKNYRDVPYHNWRHAFNVSQVMFAILMCEMKSTFSDLEVLGMFVGCLCHDLDHRGTNNAYQQKTGSALVRLYGTTNTMEHHHFNHAVMILSSEGLNIFSSLSPENYSGVMKILKQSILATDLNTYFQLRERFFKLVESMEYSWGLEEQRELLCSMLMTGSDLAASTKPWQVQQRAASLIEKEFLEQNDKERRELNLDPEPRRLELPHLQVSWINDICLPLYKSLGRMNPKLYVMAEGAAANVTKWTELIQQKNSENNL